MAHTIGGFPPVIWHLDGDSCVMWHHDGNLPIMWHPKRKLREQAFVLFNESNKFRLWTLLSYLLLIREAFTKIKR